MYKCNRYKIFSGVAQLKIRRSTDKDRAEIDQLHLEAFGKDEGPVIADLVNKMFVDKTAEPILSLVAVDGEKLIGHILFSNVSITGAARDISAQILAPLAVHPDLQNKGLGKEIINKGLEILKASGVELVFVLGHPGYYPRSGFRPAGMLGFEAPYPIAEEHAEAWMVQELRGSVIGSVKGKVKCCEALSQPHYWQE